MQQVGLAVPQYLLSSYSSSIVKIFYNYGHTEIVCQSFGQEVQRAALHIYVV